jgi:hypothetical protein
MTDPGASGPYVAFYADAARRAASAVSLTCEEVAASEPPQHAFVDLTGLAYSPQRRSPDRKRAVSRERPSSALPYRTSPAGDFKFHPASEAAPPAKHDLTPEDLALTREIAALDEELQRRRDAAHSSGLSPSRPGRPRRPHSAGPVRSNSRPKDFNRSTFVEPSLWQFPPPVTSPTTERAVSRGRARASSSRGIRVPSAHLQPSGDDLRDSFSVTYATGSSPLLSRGAGRRDHHHTTVVPPEALPTVVSTMRTLDAVQHRANLRTLEPDIPRMQILSVTSTMPPTLAQQRPSSAQRSQSRNRRPVSASRASTARPSSAGRARRPTSASRVTRISTGQTGPQHGRPQVPVRSRRPQTPAGPRPAAAARTRGTRLLPRSAGPELAYKTQLEQMERTRDSIYDGVSPLGTVLGISQGAQLDVDAALARRSDFSRRSVRPSLALSPEASPGPRLAPLPMRPAQEPGSNSISTPLAPPSPETQSVLPAPEPQPIRPRPESFSLPAVSFDARADPTREDLSDDVPPRAPPLAPIEAEAEVPPASARDLELALPTEAKPGSVSPPRDRRVAILIILTALLAASTLCLLGVVLFLLTQAS